MLLRTRPHDRPDSVGPCLDPTEVHSVRVYRQAQASRFNRSWRRDHSRFCVCRRAISTFAISRGGPHDRAGRRRLQAVVGRIVIRNAMGYTMKMHNPPHPGEVLRELCLKPLGLSVTDAARSLGVSRQDLVEHSQRARWNHSGDSRPPLARLWNDRRELDEPASSVRSVAR